MRGISAIKSDTEITIEELETTIPCYFGCAPYWQVDSSKYNSVPGKSFVIRSVKEATTKIGYMEPKSGVFPKYASLCEAVYTHFKFMEAGPILVIVNDQKVTETDVKSAQLVMSKGKGILDVRGLAILSSVSISGKEKGTDFSVEYDDYGQKLIIIENSDLGNEITLSWKEVEVDAIELTKTTFENLTYIEQETGYIPDVIAAPGWEKDNILGEHIYYDTLIELAEKAMDSHWQIQAYAQIDEISIDDAKQAKDSAKIKSSKMKICYPYVQKDGLILSLSTVTIAAKMLVDAKNEGIPFESASNEIIDIDKVVNSNGDQIRISQEEANGLNNVGIATCAFICGDWRTWGICMSNYSAEVDDLDAIDPREQNDVAVQMHDYICNDFQLQNIDYIDKPMSPKTAQAIAQDYQVEVLDVLVKAGALLYGNIEVNTEDSNTTKGDFKFDIRETNTPPGKSITARVMWSDVGLAAYEEDD